MLLNATELIFNVLLNDVPDAHTDAHTTSQHLRLLSEPKRKSRYNIYHMIIGCYEKDITYSYPDDLNRVPIPMTQIESLIQLSDFCEQEIHYDCTLAPLTAEDIDFAFWEDRHGNKNNYFTGNNEYIKLSTRLTVNYFGLMDQGDHSWYQTILHLKVRVD